MAKDYEGVGDLTGPPEKIPAKERAKSARKTSKAYFKALDTMAKDPKVSKESKKNMLKNWEEAADTADKEEYEAGMKRGGVVKSSVSRRADGCAKRGRTRGKMV